MKSFSSIIGCNSLKIAELAVYKSCTTSQACLLLLNLVALVKSSIPLIKLNFVRVESN